MEKIYDKEEIAYEHEMFIYDYSNEMGEGGWVAQDKSSFIKGNDVKKELQKPRIKQFDATRKVYMFHFYAVFC